MRKIDLVFFDSCFYEAGIAPENVGQKRVRLEAFIPSAFQFHDYRNGNKKSKWENSFTAN